MGGEEMLQLMQAFTAIARTVERTVLRTMVRAGYVGPDHEEREQEQEQEQEQGMVEPEERRSLGGRQDVTGRAWMAMAIILLVDLKWRLQREATRAPITLAA
jgi:hypothetical protein